MYLADGEVAFFGRREQALQYFESIGLECPPYYNMAGTLLWTNKTQILQSIPLPLTVN